MCHIVKDFILKIQIVQSTTLLDIKTLPSFWQKGQQKIRKTGLVVVVGTRTCCTHEEVM